MAVTSYDSLVSQIAPFCAGAPYPSIVFAITDAARTLCKRSQCWTEWQDVALTPNESEYSIDPQNGSSSSRLIRWVLINGRKLQPTSNAVLANSLAHLLDAKGDPTHYLMNQEMSVVMFPCPSDAQIGMVAKVNVSFVPTYDATSIPSHLIERFAESLILGAKAYMLAMPRMPWSDPQAASFYKQQFNEEVTKAEIELLTDYGRSDLVINQRAFG